MTRKLAGLILAVWTAAPAWAAGEEAFEFFAEERQVVTASRRAQSLLQAPATVYIVTGEDIRFSGAQNLWDALRGVPGMDVLTTRTGQGEVSMRGLNGPLSNRTLVMLDGKTILNGYFDFAIWEEVPVPMEEIDRIEVVEGPASAIYGANALTGAINIITKTPDQLKGGVVGVSGGERATRQGEAIYGRRVGPAAYKASASWRSTRKFEDKDRTASKVGKGHVFFSRDLGDKGMVSVDAGGADLNTEVTTGSNGTVAVDGPSGFVKSELSLGAWKTRVFWNRARIQARDFSALKSPNLDYDTYDVQAERTCALPWENGLVAGASYRRNTMKSLMFQPGLLSQDLWSVFIEDEWRPREMWSVTAGARLDRHPFTRLQFSPRGSVLFTPSEAQTFRFSAGTSFRNPTLLQNYLQLPRLAGPVTLLLQGNQDLDSERMTLYEAAHRARWGWIQTSAAVFVYKLKNILVTTPFQAVSPTLRVSSFINESETSAWGGEAGVDARFSQRLWGFVNASGQDLKDRPDSYTRDEYAPKWKVNGGLRARAARFSTGATVHWVDRTYVDPFALLDVYGGYAFKDGWELSAGGFNVGGKRHRQLPATSFGEEIASRWTAGVTRRF